MLVVFFFGDFLGTNIGMSNLAKGSQNSAMVAEQNDSGADGEV